MKKKSEVIEELEAQLDRAVYGTNDRSEIRKKFDAGLSNWQKQRSTIGGYLEQLRRKRKLRVAQCAERVGVSKATWSGWESNLMVPSNKDIEDICGGLGFCAKKRARLRELLLRAPRTSLLMMSRSLPQSIAAKGTNNLGANIDWESLPRPLRETVVFWGKEQGYSFPEELPGFFSQFEDDEAREAWVDEMVNGTDGLD